MSRQEAREAYEQALKLGQKEYRSLIAQGLDPYPAVLDNILEEQQNYSVQDIGLVEIPADLIVGTKSAGRISAFSANFLPLLNPDSEFGFKWISLCADHLSDGIRDPIQCFEYLGKFYVQEGNKRVSVLKYMDAPRVSGTVKRVLPPYDAKSPRIRAYYEFLDFYKSTSFYRIQFHQPGDYARLLACLGKTPGEPWTDREKRTLAAYYQYFLDAFYTLSDKSLHLLPEEALLMWLQFYPFRDLGQLSARELKNTLDILLDDMVTISRPDGPLLRTDPTDTTEHSGLLNWLMPGTADHLNIAFVNALDPTVSTWIEGHDKGRRELEEALGSRITVRSYFHADTPQLAEELLEKAVADGADVIFTTTPQLRRPALRVAVKYPKVHFLNCSTNTCFSSIHSYYSRIYEAKFITGAIAGAMSPDDDIGYIGSYPIFGVPASINAFALGAQLTNPRAKIHLRWSCMEGSPQADLIRDGIHVLSNRDVPTDDRMYLNFCNYGTYMLDDCGNLEPLASPVWLWGKFYETMVRSILSGHWGQDADPRQAVNYWWGLDSGVIDVQLSDKLPESVKTLANILRDGIRSGSIDPFRRRVVSQDGMLRCTADTTLNPDELLRMDWLVENVIGSIPSFDEIMPIAQPMVREIGVNRDQIPVEKEGSI